MIVEVPESRGFFRRVVFRCSFCADAFARRFAFAGASSRTGRAAGPAERLLFLLGNAEAANSAAPIVRTRHVQLSLACSDW